MIARITMPIVLTRELSPNGSQGTHWTYKSRPRARVKEEARRATVSHINGNAPGVAALMATRDPLIMDIEVEWPKGAKRWDEDNIVTACKGIRDGIATALWDGEDAHVRVGTVSQVRGEGGLAFTFRVDAG
ncbi:MAG: hypothetical protein AB7R89_13760 [Dehalococcoidia bacterium]